MAFSWFKRKPAPVADERVWVTSAARLAGLHSQTVALCETQAVVVLLAHFPDMLKNLHDMLDAHGLAYEHRKHLPASELDAIARRDQPAQILTALASALHFDDLPNDSLPARGVTMLLSERHPLRAKDDAIDDFSGGVPCKLTIHLSLDDALLKLFAGNVIEVLRRMGIDESAPIESPMVSTAIRSAQKKIETQATADRDAPSAEEWLRSNVPRA